MASKVRGCKSFTQAVISQETFQLSTFPPILMDLRKYISPICGRVMIWPCGPTDKASDYESGDCRFESCQGQLFFPAEMLEGAKKFAPPGGLEPPTFRLTAERASRLRHGGFLGYNETFYEVNIYGLLFQVSFPASVGLISVRLEKNCVGRESNPDQLLGRQLC